MTFGIGGARSRWRRVALVGGGIRPSKGEAAPRPSATIREVCLVGDPSRRYRHRAEVAARLQGAGEGL